jgi:hypothetical protein
MPKTDWITDQILRAAGELERAGGTVRAFPTDGGGAPRPTNPSPPGNWVSGPAGVRRGLIVLNSHWFRLGSGRRSSFGFFVRNEAGLTVGLRPRVPHAGRRLRRARSPTTATRAPGPASNRIFWTSPCGTNAARWLFTRKPKPPTGCWKNWRRNSPAGYHDGLPTLALAEGQKPPDAHQKAAHILRARPDHFWAVSPNRRLAFAVRYDGRGVRFGAHRRHSRWPRGPISSRSTEGN